MGKLDDGILLDSSVYDESETTQDGTVFSDLIIMPKHKDRADLINDGIIDKSIVSISFDGWDSHTAEVMAPYLYEKGIPFTVFVGFNDKYRADAMTSERLQAFHTIKQYGGEVQLYTSQPKETFLGTTNYVEQYNQLKQAYDRFLTWGFEKPRFCAYSSGVSSEILDNVLHEFGIKAGRTTSEGTVGSNISETAFRYPSFYLCGKNFKDKNWNAINSTYWYKSRIPKFIMTHKITTDEDDSNNSADLTEAHFKSFIDDIATYITQYGYVPMSLSQFWEYIHFPKDAKVGQHCLIWEGDNRQHEYVKTELEWRELTKI
ncbi:hypothetical protein [Pseudobutyrivibrio xylanivorans]|uniref:Polysaccharide deacetylase n=1 Tax=Pseudobutyrivibrio xylanivorans TaxID=185007 RepID=A0A1G5S1T9_PSEXY|nr:hypothetical protein [Pseudobutyrivibrio xylanivorans]SCZ79701.1 hypothetical protein SAMN02910350_01906 [Pseudobutyrivibrio xylanivorans]